MTASRRDFLRTTSLLSATAAVPTFLARTAFAAKPGAKDTILVVVQLTGGNDGLNTVIPFNDPLYAKYRPTIALPKDRVRKLNDTVGLHSSMAGFEGLHKDGKLTVVQGVGYPNPSQSHFRSMDIWQAGSMDETLTEGWLGKSLKSLNAPAFHVAGANEASPLAVAGAPARVPSITSLADFQLKLTVADGSDRSAQKSILREAAAPTSTPGLLDFVKSTAVETYASSDRLRDIGKNYQAKATYPGNNALAERLKLCAQLIDGGLGARLFYVSIDGFDTHAGQGGVNGAHANLLQQVSDAVTAFYRDCSAHGHGERVCVLTFSEFGRRAKENGSKGTDHGSAAPTFLVGPKGKGVVGDHPNLEKLEAGNLRHAIDFRSVYAAVLDQWLGVSSKTVLGAEFAPVNVFA